MDVSPKQLIKETRSPIPCKPGQDKRIDFEYSRKGVCNIFMVNEPLVGKRFVKVTKTRCKTDWAKLMKHISDDLYPNAERITIVMDNLASHSPAALYESFSPNEAKRLWDRMEFIFTTKHGSWLN